MRLSVATALLTLTLALPIFAAPEPKKTSPVDESAQIAEKLLERIDVEQQDNPLRHMLDWLQAKSGLTMLIDTKAIGTARGPEAVATLNDSAIRLPTMINVRTETVLRAILDQIDADYVIAPDHIKITTHAVKDLITGSAKSLPELYSNLGEESPQLERNEIVRTTPYVTMAFRDTPAADAFKEIAARAGRNVIISAPAAEKAKAAITVNLSNVAFETAAASLAEAAGLRAFRTGNVVVIVTPERAKQAFAGADMPPRIALGGLGGLGGNVLTLDELTSIGKLFSAKPADADARRKELEEKIRKLTEELERTKGKN